MHQRLGRGITGLGQVVPKIVRMEVSVHTAPRAHGASGGGGRPLAPRFDHERSSGTGHWLDTFGRVFIPPGANLSGTPLFQADGSGGVVIGEQKPDQPGSTGCVPAPSSSPGAFSSLIGT